MSQDKEREAFEAWYFDKNMKPPIRHHLREDEYEFTHARDAWEGWQARAALATQPPAVQGEPVAWRYSVQPQVLGPSKWVFSETKDTPDAQPLYASTPSREPLTDEQLQTIYREFMLYQDGLTPSGLTRVARAIERAHGIHSREGGSNG